MTLFLARLAGAVFSLIRIGFFAGYLHVLVLLPGLAAMSVCHVTVMHVLLVPFRGWMALHAVGHSWTVFHIQFYSGGRFYRR